MNTYTFPLPAGAVVDDIIFAAVPATIPAPDHTALDLSGAPALVLTYTTIALTAAQQTNFAALVATNPHPANVPYKLAAAGQLSLAGASAALRNLAQQAATTTATSGNVVAVVNGILNDLVPLLNHLADVCDTFGIGQ